MKRQWNFDVEEGGSQEGQNLALALAAIAGPEFLRSLLDCYAAMSRLGGETYIGTYRDKFAETPVVDEMGEVVRDEFGRPETRLVKVTPDEMGTWYTLGFAVHYESVAKLTDKVTESEREPDDRLSRPRPLETAPENGHESNIQEADREALAAIEEPGA